MLLLAFLELSSLVSLLPGAEAAAVDVAAANSSTRSKTSSSSNNPPKDRASVVLEFLVTVVDVAEALVVAGTKMCRMPTLLRADKPTGVI